MFGLSKKSLDELLKQKEELESPGAWDFDSDAAFTRNYFLNLINEELKKRDYKEGE